MHTKVNAYIRLMRLDKPVGIWLLFWPCAWSITLASEGNGWQTILLFLVGAVVMRSAGCIVNDMADREFDRKVARTQTRPLASGELSMKEAALMLLVLLVVALGVVLQLPVIVFGLACAALPLVFVYPFMKRITWWPQAFLGLTFNFGALMGWAAITQTLPWQALALYGAGFLWTLGYDTLYGHQDKKDDAQIGVKSTSLRLQNKTIPFVAGCYGGTIGLLITVLGYKLALLPVAMHFIWQLRRIDLDMPESCLHTFRSNQWAGGLIWLALYATATDFMAAF